MKNIKLKSIGSGLTKTFLALALAGAAATSARAGTHTWSGASNGYWSVAGNWSSGGAPTNGESPLHLTFPSGATRLATTNDVAPLAIDSITIIADGYTFAALVGNGITLKGTGLSVIGSGNATFGASMGITLNGFTYFSIATNKLVTVDGAISGPGTLAKISPGTLRLHTAASNSYAGGTLVNEGTLLLECGGVAVPGVLNIGTTNTAAPSVFVRLAASEQIANSAAVTVNANGYFDGNGRMEAIGALTGNGVVNMDSGQLNVGADNSDFTFDGTISGTAPTVFMKMGNGTMTLAGNVSGGSQVYGGRLYVNGNHSGAISVQSSMGLGGTGTVGNVRFIANSFLRPGSGLGAMPGIFTSGSATLTNGSLYFADLAGTDAGTGYDQVRVTGAVDLTGSRLSLRLGAATPENTEFVLIDNDGGDYVTGAFSGLAEGTIFATNGIQFRITYKGGDGNDVMLTQITPPPAPQFQGIKKLVSGQMQINGSGIPGVTYAVQASTNLSSTNWTVLGSLTASGAGSFTFTDTNALSHPMRYYRFVAP